MNSQNTWCVYKHISPSNKVYIGITHHINPKNRWGKNGNKYRKNTVFYYAIIKYGWDNIRHEILYRNCSSELAKEIEVQFIAFYKMLNLSYNMTIGGDGQNYGKQSGTSEYRTNKSRIYRKNHTDYDKNQYLIHGEAIKERSRIYYEKNKEKVLAYKRTDKVKEKARIRAAEWRAKHPDYMKAYMKDYNSKKRKNNE